MEQQLGGRFGTGRGGQLLLWLCIAMGQSISAPPKRQFTENEVKAAYLLNFAKFVEWNPGEREAPVLLCVIGEDPFGTVLDETIQGESVNGRPIAIKRSQSVAPSCNIVFTKARGSNLAEVLSSAGMGVLTVGEGKEFIEEGGMIAFVLEDRRLRFDVSLRAAVRAAVQISSRLLKVARSVQK